MGESAGAHLALLLATSADVTLWATADMPNPSVSSRVQTGWIWLGRPICWWKIHVSRRVAGAKALAYLRDRQVPVDCAGKQGSPGLDQYNIEIPASFAGQGTLTLSLSIDGAPATPVRVTNYGHGLQ